MPSAQRKISFKYRDLSVKWKETYSLPFSVCLETKIREFPFKILINILFTNDNLFRFNMIDSPLRAFCKTDKSICFIVVMFFFLLNFHFLYAEFFFLWCCRVIIQRWVPTQNLPIMHLMWMNSWDWCTKQLMLWKTIERNYISCSVSDGKFFQYMTLHCTALLKSQTVSAFALHFYLLCEGLFSLTSLSEGKEPWKRSQAGWAFLCLCDTNLNSFLDTHTYSGYDLPATASTAKNM